MSVAVLRADARRLPLPDASVDLICTSPPYFGLRSYTDNGEHYAGQIGSEGTPAEWLAALVECTREWVRVLKPSGSIFVNLGDRYSGSLAGSDNGAFSATGMTCPSKSGTPSQSVRRKIPQGSIPTKSLMGLPWRYALACTDELGLILRRDIIWSKPNGLPESVTDRCRSSHEYVFHLVRQPRYYAAVDEIREGYAPATFGRNRYGRPVNGHPSGEHTGPLRSDRGVMDVNPLGKLPGSVWNIPSQPLQVPAHLGVDHFAAFPLELPRRCILGWSPPDVCTACGEGRRPVALTWLGRKERDTPPYGAGNHGTGGSTLGSRGPGATITGYACACTQPDAPTTPAVILDPFMGTGTTLLAASALGRVGIGCDLSMDYARLARWRTTDRTEIAKAMQVPKPPPVIDGQDTLFAL